MLVLKVPLGGFVQIGDSTVKLLETKRGFCRLGVHAPRDMKVLRQVHVEADRKQSRS